MLGTYRAVFRVPGTAAFCAAGFLMRLPIALYPIAMLLLVSTRTHHYAFAGALSGSYIFGGAPGNPIGARLVDRFGQRRVLLPATGLHVASIATLIALVDLKTPDWTLLAPAAMAGFSYLSVGSLARARWSHVLADRPELATAYSLESTLDELIFVLGPLIATVLATQVDALLPLVLGAALVASGAVALWRLHDTEPSALAKGTEPQPSALRHQGMLLITLVSVGMGAVFASAEVTTVAFCGQRGHQSLAGLVLAGIALGSATSGFLYGARTWQSDLLDRFRVQAVIFAVLPVVLLLAVSIPVLAVLGFVLGMGIAPMLITSFGVISHIVPSGALTEGLAWLTTGLNLGYGLGSALVGRIADAHGARLAFTVTIGAGVLAGAFALRLHLVLRRTADAVEPAEGIARQ
jgi:MFS family permease